MRVNRKAFLAVLGVLLLSACGGSDATGVNGDASGTYTLRTFGGQLLPYTPAGQNPADFFTFNGGSVTINTDATFSETIVYSETTTGQMNNTTSTCFGTYSQAGSTIFFSEPVAVNPDCGGNFAGTWNGGNTLTLTFDVGVTTVVLVDAVYTK